MVIDWISHINKCVEEKKIIFSFHATRMEKHYQQILIVKKLLSLEYTAEDILQWFLTVEEKSEKSLWTILDMIDTANKTRWPHNHSYKIYITENEIKYIQNLNTTKECKSFLLATVAFCKMMMIKRKKPTFNKRERSYIYYLATGKDEYNTGSHRAPYIEAFIRKLEKDQIIQRKIKVTNIKKNTGKRGGTVIDLTDIILNMPWVEWKVKKGYKITNLDAQIAGLCNDLFEEDLFVCSKCGKHFAGNNKTKRTLCIECYNKTLAEQKRKYEKERYNDRTWFVFKHTNTLTKEAFISIDDSTHGDRWKEKEWYKNQTLFQEAINLYGWENFEHTVLEDGIKTKEEAYQKEKDFIKEEKTYIGYLNSSGYNMKKQANMQIRESSWSSEEIKKLANVFKKNYGEDRSARKENLEKAFPDQKYQNLMKKARELGFTQIED